MEDKNRFSILLEHLLEVAEVKNYTLAKRLQYDVSYISKWVSGRIDRKSTRLNSSHIEESRMPSSA